MRRHYRHSMMYRLMYLGYPKQLAWNRPGDIPVSGMYVPSACGISLNVAFTDEIIDESVAISNASFKLYDTSDTLTRRDHHSIIFTLSSSSCCLATKCVGGSCCDMMIADVRCKQIHSLTSSRVM
ncbi:hypothetical protein KQX54_017013 [Cotesia glomerata]|uniref:Uncharacterized protein n=1 Tax=Cotesia glomerata TaxID=32391 RepID=A0AAV7I8Q6_COTGL|nr:hypothetical protein KQX54_017013 [Cotesia glomerata]